MLHSKLKFNSKIVYSVKEINLLDWNTISTDNIFLEVEYLKSIEETVNEVHQFIYVIYYDIKDKPIGKSIFQLLQYDTTTFNFNSIPCSFQNKILRRFLNKKLTILIAGNIFATGENIHSFTKEINNEDILYNINIIIDKLFKANKTINYAVFKEFYPNNETSSLLIKKCQYLKFNIDVNMALELNTDWHNFNDITNDFKTKYRSRAKSVIKKSNTLIIKELSLEHLTIYANRIEELYQQVLKNSNFNIGIFTIETFKSLKKNLKEKYTVYGYFIEDNLIGFRSAFITNTILETSFIGIDYSLNLKYDLYQKMLMDYVEDGLKNNVNDICFGRTAETIKSCVGAQPLNMNLFIRPKKRTGLFLLKLIIDNIKPTEFSLRSPFKKEFYSKLKNTSSTKSKLVLS